MTALRSAAPVGRASRTVAVVVIGAGHAGLAISYWLDRNGVDHVILERGEIANSWRHERWDSLRLLTPNWLCRLPGFGYEGCDPDGFMAMPEVVDFIERYAWGIDAPVRLNTTVSRVVESGRGFCVETPADVWHCRAVVMANGASSEPCLPGCAQQLAPQMVSVTTDRYRNPGDLPEGGTLVVGASASGLQIAEELHASGREVLLSVGEHVRMPRAYRGRDIQWWMKMAGLLDQDLDTVDDIRRARSVPSPQLIGGTPPRTLDLNVLTRAGVSLAGRVTRVDGTRIAFSGALANQCKLADLKMNRMLTAFDEWAATSDACGGAEAPERFADTRLPCTPLLEVDLSERGIRSVVWATGYRPNFGFLQVPAFDARGRLRHDGGFVQPGLYVTGLPFLRKRQSSFIHGAEDDSRAIVSHLVDHLAGNLRFAQGR